MGKLPGQFLSRIRPVAGGTADRITIVRIILGLYAFLLAADIGNFLALEFGADEPFSSFTWWINELTVGRILLVWLLSRATFRVEQEQGANVEVVLSGVLTIIVGIIDALRGVDFAIIGEDCNKPVCYLEAGKFPVSVDEGNGNTSADNLPKTTQFTIAIWTSFLCAVFELLFLVIATYLLRGVESDQKDEEARALRDRTNRAIETDDLFRDFSATNRRSVNNLRSARTSIVESSSLNDIETARQRVLRYEQIGRIIVFVLTLAYTFFFGNFLLLEFAHNEPYRAFIPWFLLYIHVLKIVAVFLSFIASSYIYRARTFGVVRIIAVLFFVFAIADVATAIVYGLQVLGPCDERFCYGTAGNTGDPDARRPTRYALTVFGTCIAMGLLEIVLGALYLDITIRGREFNTTRITAAGVSSSVSYSIGREQARGYRVLGSQPSVDVSAQLDADSTSESTEFLNFIPPATARLMDRGSRQRNVPEKKPKKIPQTPEILTAEQRKRLQENAKFD